MGLSDKSDKISVIFGLTFPEIRMEKQGPDSRVPATTTKRNKLWSNVFFLIHWTSDHKGQYSPKKEQMRWALVLPQHCLSFQATAQQRKTEVEFREVLNQAYRPGCRHCMGRSNREGGAVQRETEPQRFLPVFTQILLSTCMLRKLPKAGKRTTWKDWRERCLTLTPGWE